MKVKTEAGAWAVLIFWPNFRLAVLIAVVLIKRACKRILSLKYKPCVYPFSNRRVSFSGKAPATISGEKQFSSLVGKDNL